MLDIENHQWTEQERSIGSVDESTAGDLREVCNQIQPNEEPVLWPSKKEQKQESPVQWLSKGGHESVPEDMQEEKKTPRVLRQSNRGIVLPKKNTEEQK